MLPGLGQTRIGTERKNEIYFLSMSDLMHSLSEMVDSMGTDTTTDSLKFTNFAY